MKVAARRVVFDAPESTRGVESRARVPDHRASRTGDNFGLTGWPNTSISLRSEGRAFAVLGQHLSRVLNRADRLQKGLDRALNFTGIIGQRQHPLTEFLDLRHHAH